MKMRIDRRDNKVKMQFPDIKYENIEQWNAEAQDPRATEMLTANIISDYMDNSQKINGNKPLVTAIN